MEKAQTVTRPPQPVTFREWAVLMLEALYTQGEQLATRMEQLMTQSEQLGADIAQVKADVAREIQQVIDALAAASANATELGDLRAAVTAAHTELTAMHTALVADDPAP